MPQQTKAAIAFALLCFFWGTTYLGIRIALDYFPPFYLSATRHLIAGLFFVVVAVIQRKNWPNPSEMKRLFINGLLMVVGGNGLVCWAEQTIPSGLTAIICSLSPIFITLMSILVFKGFRITFPIIIGLVLGFAGVLLISYKQITEIKADSFGISVVFLLIATLSWGGGSLFAKRYPTQATLMTIGVQMLLGGAVNFVISMCIGESPKPVSALLPEAYFALLYLIVFGSLVGYACYFYVLEFYTAARISVHSYINTIVAVLLGWFIHNEQLDIFVLAGMCVTLAGVLLTNREYNRMKKIGEQV
jgi:drug/metabolite transporter (DMT)-like permease